MKNHTETEKWATITPWHGTMNLMEGRHFIPILVTKMRPEENRFTKKVLVSNLDEPTELVVLDDHRVLLSERKGKLKLYNPKTGKIKVVADLPVYSKLEYGLMGLNIDPNFKTNRLVY